MKTKITDLFNESIGTKQRFLDNTHLTELNSIIDAIINCLQKKHKVLVCGNGGSAADSIHFAGELLGRFQMKRDALPVMSLSSDVATLTAVANDYGFEHVFERQVEALGSEGDVLFVLSTSGNSPNLVEAVKSAKKRKMTTMGLLGSGGGELKKMLDFSTVVPSDKSARIQETHITIIHVICDVVENYFFSGNSSK